MRFRYVINEINSIDKIIFIDTWNNLSTITCMYDNIVCFILHRNNLILYSQHKDLDKFKIKKTHLAGFIIGCIDTSDVYGPILTFIESNGCKNGVLDEIMLDIKLGPKYKI